MAELTGGAQGPFALIQPFMGESAQDKIRHYLDQQAAANAGAVAGDPSAPFSGAYAKPPVGAAPGAAPAGPPPMGQAPPGPNEPTSTQTPESWGSMLMDLQQQNEAQAGFNSSIGMGLAAFSQPRDREMVSKMFTPTVAPQDPFKMGESLMNMSGQQQGQDRANQIARLVNDPTQGPLIAQKLNMDWGALKAGIVTDPGMVSKITQALGTPTEQMKNLTQIDNYMGQVQQRDPKKSPEVLSMIRNAMLAGMAGPDAEQAVGDAVAYQNRTGKPAPWLANGAINVGAYKQYQANEAQKEDERGKASATLAQTQQTAEELRGNLETLRDSPGLKSILGNFAKQQAAREALANPNVDLAGVVARGVLTQDEANTVALLRKIGGAQTSEALHSLIGTGTRVTQQEVGPLTAAISTTQDLNQDFGTYVNNAINPLITRTKKLVATTYGASGNFHGMDPEYNPWVPAIFRKNAGGGQSGELYKEGSGADDIPDLGPVPDDQLAAAKAHLKDVPVDKASVLDHLQQQGYDVTRLRKTDPSKW